MFTHSLKNRIDKTSDVLINDREKPHQCSKTVRKRKKKQLKLKLERIEQNHMNRKIKMSKQNKYWKKSVQNVQRMPNELEKKERDKQMKKSAKSGQKMLNE